MATAASVPLKRKNIDLPVDTLQKLSMLAVAQGKSLKTYIENLLIAKADSVSVEIHENPSPGNDPWFLVPENILSVKKGIAEKEAGEGKEFSLAEIRNKLGV